MMHENENENEKISVLFPSFITKIVYLQNNMSMSTNNQVMCNGSRARRIVVSACLRLGIGSHTPATSTSIHGDQSGAWTMT